MFEELNKRISVFLCFVLLVSAGISQDYKEEAVKTPDPPGEMVFKPTIGLGVGMLTYYGDISRGNNVHNPLISRLGYDLRITQTLNSFLDFSFYVMHGTVSANERSLHRNLNFESKITMGGIDIAYNFDHIISKDRVAEPYLLVGIESFEYLSKTDHHDAYGNKYHYWSDGSIRNIAEDAADAEHAVRIQRDYNFDSDIRELDLDGFGQYEERSWSVPVGIGVKLNLSDQVKFRFGTTMHFTFTNYLDGVTEKSVGNRKGDPVNDRFLFTSVGLAYNLTGSRKDMQGLGEDDFTDDAFFALEMGDTDGDGITDFSDDCPTTPEGVEVNEKGCPLDADNDGVPDYVDLEINTPDSVRAIDSLGRTIPDSVLERRYLAFIDSTGTFAKTKRRVHEAQKRKPPKRYAVQIGKYREGIPADLVDLFLSIPDMESYEENGVTIFTVGDYETLPEAVKRKVALDEQGVPDAVVVSGDNMKKVPDIPDSETSDYTPDAGERALYRVQIGAFSRKLSSSIFEDVPALVSFTSDEGLTRYYTGSFDNYQEAAKRKVEMVMKGFEGAFVVALKGGKRVPLSEAGATPVKNREAEINKVENSSSTTAVNKDKIRFKVQVGAFKRQVPTDILEQYLSIGNVSQQKGDDGHVRYVTGSFSSYAEAAKFKEEIIKKGIEGAFVVGEFDGQIIPAKEAMDLLNN